jgi:hypothetical protein
LSITDYTAYLATKAMLFFDCLPQDCCQQVVEVSYGCTLPPRNAHTHTLINGQTRQDSDSRPNHAKRLLNKGGIKQLKVLEGSSWFLLFRCPIDATFCNKL